MSPQIQTEHFTNALYGLLDETFDNVHGYYLDKGTSMFETLATGQEPFFYRGGPGRRLRAMKS